MHASIEWQNTSTAAAAAAQEKQPQPQPQLQLQLQLQRQRQQQNNTAITGTDSPKLTKSANTHRAKLPWGGDPPSLNLPTNDDTSAAFRNAVASWPQQIDVPGLHPVPRLPSPSCPFELSIRRAPPQPVAV